jgi:hypothetical protein
MKIVLLIEGWTEKELPPFLKRWLDTQLPQPIRIQPVRFEGNQHYLDDVANKTHLHLATAETIAVFGLLDLYGLKLDYPKYADRDQRIKFARDHITDRITPAYRPRFRQHFAVHETEAWFLSEPRLFQSITLPKQCERPEDVNFDEPPAKLLDRLFSQGREGRGYKKTTMARNLLPKLDPSVVYRKCPNFKFMMDDMPAMSRQAMAA